MIKLIVNDLRTMVKICVWITESGDQNQSFVEAWLCSPRHKEQLDKN